MPSEREAVESVCPRSRPGRAARIALATHALGAGLALVSAAYRFTSPQSERVPELVWIWIVASGLYLAAAWLAARPRSVPAGAVVFWALAMRAFSIGHAPELTTDYHRYLWDAKVQDAGTNPYVFAPADPVLKELRDDNWRQVNFRSVPTIYPPVSQFVFRLAYVAGGLEALRWLFLTFEVLAWVSILVLLRRQGRPEGLLAWFAWCPLAVLEVAFNLHQDVIGVSLLLGALALAGAPAGAALALSVLSKGYSVLLLPVLVRFWRGRFVAAFIAVSILAVVPYVGAGEAMLGGLREYLGAWRGHGLLYPLLLRGSSWVTAEPERLAMWTAAAALLATAAVVAIRTRQPTDGPVAAGVVLSALILLSPVVYPWYLLWVAAFLPFTRSLPWAVLSCSTLAAYVWFVDRTPVPGIVWVEYVPFVGLYALLGVAACVKRVRGASQGAGGAGEAGGDQLT